MIFSLSGCVTITKTMAGDKAQNYLNKYVLRNGITSKLGEIKLENGLYLVNVDIMQGESKVDSVKVYVTKDGQNLILGNVYNLTKPPEGFSEAAEDKGAAAQATKTDIPKTSKPEVKLYIMSGCPYGVQAESAFMPVVKALGDSVSFEPHYILSDYGKDQAVQYCYDADGKYCSMHGAEEAREDLRQICIYEQGADKWWAYLEKFNQKCKIDAETPNCFKTVAGETGIDINKVEQCMNVQGKDLLEKEVKLGQSDKADGSPTILINGVKYEGGRSPNDILMAICSGFEKKPAACDIKIEGGDAVPSAGGGACR
ncbi:MAG: thioredoxin domain-containing protein [Candidatus Caenarcaniphilales bacterium]|nr:thioredoxin domain-containing protein [Candidatus Caenarcaniphilales bacterium]